MRAFGFIEQFLDASRFTRGVAQPGSALGLGPRGRVFESLRPDYHFLFIALLLSNQYFKTLTRQFQEFFGHISCNFCEHPVREGDVPVLFYKILMESG